uniref:Uncharacterized protein n=1 Tax=Daphnia galeata TaxID=27404 RepID=A0A8J2WID9_9CRUS|nr:unnamed protein product [Daphnia galeata]
MSLTQLEKYRQNPPPLHFSDQCHQSNNVLDAPIHPSLQKSVPSSNSASQRALRIEVIRLATFQGWPLEYLSPRDLSRAVNGKLMMILWLSIEDMLQIALLFFNYQLATSHSPQNIPGSSAATEDLVEVKDCKKEQSQEVCSAAAVQSSEEANTGGVAPSTSPSSKLRDALLCQICYDQQLSMVFQSGVSLRRPTLLWNLILLSE